MKKLLLLFISISMFPLSVNNKFLIDDFKTIALTFDDGPSIYSSKILNLLKQYDYNATFFVIGNKIKGKEDIILDIYKNNNEIGNHTYSHLWATRYPNNFVLNDISKCDELIYNIIKMNTELYRPCYGAINNSLKKSINKKIIMWTLDSSDWKLKDKFKIAEYVLKNIKDKDIVLMHDTYKKTYEALEIIIPEVKKRKYQVVTVSTLNKIIDLREKNERF